MDKKEDFSYEELISPSGERTYLPLEETLAPLAPPELSGEEEDEEEENDLEKKRKEKKRGEKEEKKHSHDGHRARLRERFRRDGGFDNFQDHEILELLLTYGAPRKDCNQEAHDLLEAFGSMKGVLEASPAMLMKAVKGIGESQATIVSMAVPLARVWAKCANSNPRRIANRSDLENYCRSKLAGQRIENFYVICVDAQCRLLGERRISYGSLSEVSAYPRSVLETALNYNAYSVFFCHNHPGGTCAPSTEDITSTLQLQRLLNGVGILVLDHIIVAGAQTYSMAQHGDIDFRIRGKGV